MIDAHDVCRVYASDINPDDDLKRWRGDITTGDFKKFKHALQQQHTSVVQHMLDNHHLSPVLSCTYANPHNHTRWRHARDLIIRHTRAGDTVVDIGCGSHASVINMLAHAAPDRHYVACDLTTPLLIAYHNLSKQHDVHYVTRSLASNRINMVPHHMSDMLRSLPRGTTFYNSYSFGEMQVDELLEYLDIVASVDGRLISENYWDHVKHATCHLCDQPVQPIKPHIPQSFHLMEQRLPHVPTNDGAKIVVLDT